MNLYTKFEVWQSICVCRQNKEQDQTCPGTKEGSQDRVRGPMGVLHTKHTLSAHYAHTMTMCTLSAHYLFIYFDSIQSQDCLLYTSDAADE